ncbi:hypothetical protein ACIRRH_40810 [Kitasatospora sp. NPDC101235]|uniref:hypothetical protein n=1 Tax=Kitasatospora sp. NPDC101235 TaxID=3364101 RepID=UPI00381931D7
MGDRIKRTSAAVLLAGVATAGLAVVGQGSASAAPSLIIVNDYTGAAYVSQSTCNWVAQQENQNTYGNPYGDGVQYYYCAQRSSDGMWNLWWRHYA